MKFVPAAILAALVVPELAVLEGTVGTSLPQALVGAVAHARMAAACVAAVTAWRTGSMLATGGVGMATLWRLRLLVG